MTGAPSRWRWSTARELDQLPSRFAADDVRDRGVENGVGCRELEQLGLLHRQQQVQQQHHDRIVRDDQRAATRIAGSILKERAQPECDIRPRLATRRPVVELAQVAPTLGLVGVESRDTVRGEQIEDAELAVAKTLVDRDHRGRSAVAERDREGLAGAQVRGDPEHLQSRTVLADPADRAPRPVPGRSRRAGRRRPGCRWGSARVLRARRGSPRSSRRSRRAARATVQSLPSGQATAHACRSDRS